MKSTCLFRLFLVINLLLIMPVNKAQNPSVDILEEVIEDISVNNDDSEEINWEDKIEELSERIQQPVNLNTAPKNSWGSFLFYLIFRLRTCWLMCIFTGRCKPFMNYSW